MNVLKLPSHAKATTADLTEEKKTLLAGIALKDAGTRAALLMFARKAIEEDAARRKPATVISMTEKRQKIADRLVGEAAGAMAKTPRESKPAAPPRPAARREKGRKFPSDRALITTPLTHTMYRHEFR